MKGLLVTGVKEDDEEGISKLALEHLIESDSSRVTYQRSKSHSTVWQRFYKILLDTVEVPFVSCISCGTVYTHERSLGTSSLLRHVCGLKRNDIGALTKPLIQAGISIYIYHIYFSHMGLEKRREEKYKR